MSDNPFVRDLVPEDTPKPSQWKFFKKNIGRRATMYDCFYCGLRHKNVDCGGIFSCPNPRCNGPGVVWFNKNLKSYTDMGGSYTFDPAEREQAAVLYLKRLEEAGEVKKTTKELLTPPTVEERLDRIEKLLEKFARTEGL